MKSYSKAIPANNNSAGSGSPFNDIAKTVEALIEIRSSVPNTFTDIGAANRSTYTDIIKVVETLERSVVSFK